MAEAPSERKPRPATPVALAEPVPVSPLGHLPSFLEPPEAPDPVAQVVRLKPRGDSTPIIGAREGGDSDASTEKIEKMWEPPEEDVPLSGLSMIETAPGPEEDADRPHAGRPGDWWHHPDTKTALKEVPRGTRIERSPRFFEQMPIRFGATPQLERRGFTENMSRTGLGISCDAPLAPGEVVLFSLALPDDRRCHGVGRVVWSLPGSGSPGDPPLMGIQLERTGSGYGDLLALLASRH